MQDCKCLNQNFYLTQTAKVTIIIIINPRHRRIALSSFNYRRVWQYRVNIGLFQTLSFSSLDLGLRTLGVFDQNATECWSFLWKSCSPNLAGHGCSFVRSQPVWLLLWWFAVWDLWLTVWAVWDSAALYGLTEWGRARNQGSQRCTSLVSSTF